MEANEKTFRHSLDKILLMVLLLLGVSVFYPGPLDIFLLSLMGIALVEILFYATSRVKISDETITTNSLLSSRSLRWSEIVRVSTRGQVFRLHNDNENRVLSLAPQLDDYAELLDVIFRKRPDLFDEHKDTVRSSGWLANIIVLGFGLLLMATPVLGEFPPFLSLFLFQAGVLVIAGWLLFQKSLTLESNNLTLRSLFKQASYSASDIQSISLEKVNTKSGIMYFVQINLRSGQTVSLPAFQYGFPLMYLVLRRWHERATRLV